MNKLFSKTAAFILFVLGLAFLAGSFLAHLQGFIIQVPVLAAVGGVCLVIALVCFIMTKHSRS